METLGRSGKEVSSGSLRHSHLLNDVSIQADIHVAEPTTYESEDENIGRRKHLSRIKRGGTPLYSKQDIREQYCINERQLSGLEDTSSGLFGCLSSYQDSSCSSRSPSLLTVCMRRRIPSDENLAELARRPIADYAPFPRWIPAYHTPHSFHSYPLPRPLPAKGCFHDPYPWIHEDDDLCRMERSRTFRDFEGCPRRYLSYSSEYLFGRHEPCPAHPHMLPPPPPPPPLVPSSISHRPKHVSFARSHTMQSFDDTVSFGSGSCITSSSQERLIDGKKLNEAPKVIVMEKPKRAPMKTQATQTEVCLGRKPLPPNYLSLSPRSIQRVRMISQGAQTNGEKCNNRKLMKSLSEVGRLSIAGVDASNELHEPVQRTQSEEPRSPRIPTSPKEIFINFEPLERKGRKRLAKTMSDGEILLNGGRGADDEGEPCTQSDGELASSKRTQEEELDEMMKIEIETPPIRKLKPADSQEEEFHENLIYQNIFRKKSGESSGESDDGEEIVKPFTSVSTPSPFESCDSLNAKDHSDGIWNESQMTILHADSDNNGGGTGISGSDLSSSLTPSAVIHSMSPSSRRKYLLIQHQQRSSMDTEVLDNEEPDVEQELQMKRMNLENSPIIPTVAVTVPPPDITTNGTTTVPVQHKERKTERSISPHKSRRRSLGTRTPESDQHHSSSATLSSNEAFARSDSGKTNTDMSEASTTDDYATATENNSESSGRPLPMEKESTQLEQRGNGSFESGSSLYSLTRADAIELEPVIVSSPPPPQEVSVEKKENNGEDRGGDGDGDTSSAESSSCGSYSVEGSSDKLGQSDKSQCSSTGGYDSPFDEGRKRRWTPEDSHKVKKGFKLELKAGLEGDGARELSKASPQKSEDVEGEPSSAKPSHAVKRAGKEGALSQKSIVPPLDLTKKDEWSSVRSTPEDKRIKMNGVGMAHDSSEESSLECTCGKSRRRDNHRRKPGVMKSPTALARERRRSVSGEEVKRRYSIAPTKSPSPVAALGEDSLAPTKVSPFKYQISPGGSPNRQILLTKSGIASPDSARLKALSAESLRSVSPGSDSVFYSEPSSYTATDSKSASACQHCGRLYENQSKLCPEKPPLEIVQPPAGFEDSPRTPHRTRLYKKADKRYRSEERRHRMHAEAARAKSEERAREERKEKTRPLTRSTDASMEKLHIYSSFDEDDEWHGVNADAYNLGIWVYIGGTEELQVWQRPDSREEERDDCLRRASIDSTESEKDFRKKFQAITHRMVHRKSSLEMYKRLASKCFEADKKVLVKRGSEEFGFRIHGSKPVVVSCIEAGTPAETSGLEVGDIVINVNNTNVLEATHNDVVKLAHAGSDVLELQVARTCDSFIREGTSSPPLASGLLHRLSSSKSKPKWVLRHFVLKQDHYLYYYKSETGVRPLGALNVTDYSIIRIQDSERPHMFKIGRKGLPFIQLCALSQTDAERWISALSSACMPQIPIWVSDKCLNAPPTKIVRPDCAGTLSTLVHHRGKTWRRRFFILKDACLYFYSDINAEKALGVTSLHGYKVQSSTSASRKFSFELIPPEAHPSLMHYYFYTDTELDKKRWLAALEYSIDRWIKVG